MHRVRRQSLFIALVLVLALAVGFFAFAGSAPSYANGDIIPGSYIVQLQPNARAAEVANEMAQAKGLGVAFVYSGAAFNGFAAEIPEGRLRALENDPRVVSIVPDRYVSINGVQAAPPCGTPKTGPCPTPTPGGGGGGGGSQTIPTGILRINGDLSSTAAGDGSGSVDVDVAVIDSGISNHADLNVVGGINCSRGKANNYGDGNGHGTHVAGTIGAIDNNLGVVGVAPGARLWAVRVLDNSGSGSWSAVICGIDWVAANAGTIEVANMSLGGGGSDTGCGDGGMNAAICNAVNAGVTFVVAAGNEADNAANHVPAAYDQVITVSALADFDGEPGGNGSPTCRADEDDTLANFSNFGADVDIIAPGVCINSTWNDGGYNTISGTSMASPHVAGAAALYLSTHPGASPSQVQSALEAAGNTGWDNSDDGDNTKEPLLDVIGF